MFTIHPMGVGPRHSRATMRKSGRLFASKAKMRLKFGSEGDTNTPVYAAPQHLAVICKRPDGMGLGDLLDARPLERLLDHIVRLPVENGSAYSTQSGHKIAGMQLATSTYILVDVVPSKQSEPTINRYLVTLFEKRTGFFINPRVEVYAAEIQTLVSPLPKDRGRVLSLKFDNSTQKPCVIVEQTRYSNPTARNPGTTEYIREHRDEANQTNDPSRRLVAMALPYFRSLRVRRRPAMLSDEVYHWKVENHLVAVLGIRRPRA